MGNRRKLAAGLSAGVLACLGLVTTSAPPASAAVFTPSNPGPFVIPDQGSINGSVSQANAGGVVTDVNIKLNDVGSTHGDDLDIQLVHAGIAVPIMSDACGDENFEDIDLTFDDQAAGSLPDSTPNPANVCTSGTFKPTNFEATDSFPTPPTGATLAAFNGTNPNGTWTLQMVDDANVDTSDIEGGFQLTINTAPFSVLLPGTGSSGPASPYPFQFTVSGKAGKVADVNLTLGKLTHTFPDDLQAILVSPSGAKVQVLRFACGGEDMTERTLVIDDEAPTSMTDDGPCLANSYKPSAFETPVNLPAPAPAGPYAASMSAFDGTEPNGTWSLYIEDNEGQDYGFLSEDPQLVIGLTDTTAPDTKLVGKKQGNTTKRKATIKFTSDESGVTFTCKVDSKKAKPCTSPLKLKNLKLGKHKVIITAKDAAGNVDPKALKIKWKIFPKED